MDRRPDGQVRQTGKVHTDRQNGMMTYREREYTQKDRQTDKQKDTKTDKLDYMNGQKDREDTKVRSNQVR